MAQVERDRERRENKIRMERYQEQINRGFDILTNEALENEDNAPGAGDSETQSQEPSKTKIYEYYRILQEKKRQPGVWSKAMNTVNRDFMSEEEKLAVERDEEDRKKALTNFSKTNIINRMKETNASLGEQELSGMQVDRRSKRV